MNEDRAYLMEPDGRIRSRADLDCEHKMAMIERRSDASTELTVGTNAPFLRFAGRTAFAGRGRSDS